MFSSSGLLPTSVSNSRKQNIQKLRRDHLHRLKKKTFPARKLTACLGTAIKFVQKFSHDPHPLPNPYGYACSLRCKHPIHTKDRRSGSRGKSEDYIPEQIYKKYTETDSRPVTPELIRRSESLPRGKSVSDDRRKCVTPEPETRQCQFHHRRILILDLRRVKSVDAIGRQDRTPGTSIDSTCDDDGDYRSSSANQDSSILFQFSPRHLSLSRSVTPKTKPRKGTKGKKSKERSTSPIVYERSSSPKILEGLTLPPLHSSVLTLLGQRSGAKPSPRSFASAQAPDPGTTRHKKLRRHGRTRMKEEEKEKTGEDGPPGVDPHRAGSEEVKKTDDPHETQISTIGNAEKVDEGLPNETEDAEDEPMEKLQTNFKQFKESRQALRAVLDDYLAGKAWSPKEMENLDEQIDVLLQDFQNLQTKFQVGSISMKESAWLSYPRTWSRTSATFGVPHDSRSLRTMQPVDYLENCVSISIPRKHLYTLVFQRYRTMENPAGKHISLKIVQSALSEVLGRVFLDHEMKQLCEHYLGLTDMNFPILEDTFLGISAFCERIYGDYSLEENPECYDCSNRSTGDKERCHKNKKSHLEQADLAYLFAKLRDGQVQPELSNIILALCDRD